MADDVALRVLEQIRSEHHPDIPSAIVVAVYEAAVHYQFDRDGDILRERIKQVVTAYVTEAHAGAQS